ncbi:phosphohydrolase [Clostridium zeae]|uniref:Phosphohydrolase n=1 Tax=Clostridium zeae TaxID=2759022 RepID=A0ABQ1EBG3_9CLOT|nr:metallophosphoesterase [Clostridium zeae]GFZ32110.1 phosphohydrolase [Clostridium zeae]
MKRNKSLLKVLIASITAVGLICGTSISAFAQGRYEFDVISDTHVGHSSTDITNTTLALNCIKNKFPDSKCIVINGDVVDNNQKTSYDALYNIISNVNSTTTKLPYIYFNYGNHEFRANASDSSSNYTGNLAYFNQRTRDIQARLLGNKGNVTINERTPGSSYDMQYINKATNDRLFFLGTDYIPSGNTDNSYLDPNTQLYQLGLAINANKTESINTGIKKPLFVFSHQPIANTVWGSETSRNWGNIIDSDQLISKLANHPEVITFTSHIHKGFTSGANADDFYSLGGNDSWGNIFSTSSVSYDPNSNPAPAQGYHVIVWSNAVTVQAIQYISNTSYNVISSHTIYY